MTERLFLLICHDSQDGTALERRQRNADAHMRHAERVRPDVRIAGLTTDEGGTAIVASVLIVAAADAAAARAVVEADPFWQAGVWERVDCHPFVPAVGTWVGGWSPTLAEDLAPLLGA